MWPPLSCAALQPASTHLDHDAAELVGPLDHVCRRVLGLIRRKVYRAAKLIKRSMARSKPVLLKRCYRLGVHAHLKVFGEKDESTIEREMDFSADVERAVLWHAAGGWETGFGITKCRSMSEATSTSALA